MLNYYIQRIDMKLKLIIMILILIVPSIQKITLQTQIGYSFQTERQKILQQNIVKIKQYSNQQQLCGNQTCLFQYYIYKNQSISKEKNRNFTILLISGLKGDDEIGPQLLMKSYGILNAATIIYVPYLNPSGTFNKQNNTFPGNFDVEKDFPLNWDEIQNCNKTAGFKLLTKIFNTYQIDLSIYVHSGRPIMSFSWHKDYNLTKLPIQTNLYQDIARKLKNVEQRNNYQIKDQLRIGNYKISKEEDSGYFVDWAYGSAREPAILKEECNKIPVNKDLFKKMHGLSFSLGLGQPQKTQNIQKYIKRGQAWLRQALLIVNPNIRIRQFKKTLLFTLKGCKTGKITDLTILNSKNQATYILSKDKMAQKQLILQQASQTQISFENIKIQKQSTYIIEYVCDNRWQKFGETKFTKLRELEQKGNIIGDDIAIDFIKQDPKEVKITQKNENTMFSWFKFEWNIYTFILTAILSFFFIIWFIFGLMYCIKAIRRRRVRNFHQTFQNIQYIQQDTFSYDSSDPRNKVDLSEQNTENLERQSLKAQK